MIKKIISGGQTGVDRAALDVAIELKIPHGGWCPKGRLAENGTIPEQYLLKETISSEYSERTMLNINDSNGTLILVPEDATNITDGTNLTKNEVKDKGKPHLIIKLSQEQPIDVNPIIEWVEKNNIEVLNIAGPRESQSPGIYKLSCQFLEKILPLIYSPEETPRFSC